MHFAKLIRCKRKPSNTFGSNLQCIFSSDILRVLRWCRAKLCHSITTPRGKYLKKKKEGRNLSDPGGRRTYLYIWIFSLEESVWNLIHKHYPHDSPVFPSPEEKAGSSSEPLCGNFSTTQSSFCKFNKRADWDLAPAMFHQTYLSSAIAGLSVSQTPTHRPGTFLRFPLLSSESVEFML